MKRLVLLALLASVVIAGLWFLFQKMRGGTPTAVTTVLPRDTLLLAYVPDFDRARIEWHNSDLYRLWREPEVQEFLRRPLDRSPAHARLTGRLQQLQEAGVREAFFALTGESARGPAFAAGFRFTKSKQAAEQLVADLFANAGLGSQPTRTESHHGNDLRVVETRAGTLATVFAGNRFFAANDIAGLKLMLDRAEGRARDQSGTLAIDDDFRNAMKHMPGRYVGLFYARADRLWEKAQAFLGGATPQASPTAEQQAPKTRAICVALRFDGGKMRDTIFMGRPRVQEGEISRDTLALASADAFLYGTALVDFHHPGVPGLLGRPGPAAVALLNLRRLLAGAASADADWAAAFGDEATLIGEWKQDVRWPTLLLAMPVRDRSKAEALLNSALADQGTLSTWSRQDRDGLTFLKMRSTFGLLAFAPAIGVSDKLAIAALEAEAVETALKPDPPGGLRSAARYQAVQGLLRHPEQAFVYFDTEHFYRRLDETVRPILLMSAAFVPALGENIDTSKLPEPDTVAKHLSPIVLSQRYAKDGYLTESLGPITAHQAAIGLGLTVSRAAEIYQRIMRTGLVPPGAPPNLFPPAQVPATPAVPASSPTTSPAATP